MASSTLFRVVTTMLVAAIAVVPLSACSGSAAGGTSGGGLTLAQVKSPVQLLRNEAADRIPADAVSEVIQPTDESSACKSTADDPKELYRTWTSGVLVLTKLAADKPNVIMDTLIQSFLDQGWTKGDSTSEAVTHLVKDTTFATIDIYDQDEDEKNNIEGGVQITVNGACVETGGPDSLEVHDLEKKTS